MVMETEDLGKPINTCLSAGTDIENNTIAQAKVYLSEKYNNKYNLTPHLTYMICPFPEYNLQKIIPELDAYFKEKRQLVLRLNDLHFNPRRKFFSMPISGTEVNDIHKDLVLLFNKFLDGSVRAKDIERIKAGERDAKEIELIKKYGYFRIFDNFTPHITIGNVEAEDAEIPAIEQKLKQMLADLINNDIIVDNVHVTFHTDSEVQSEMQEIWGKDYKLQTA